MPQHPPLDERGLSLPTYGNSKMEESSGTSRYGATAVSPALPKDDPGGITKPEDVSNIGVGGGGGTATLSSCAINLANTIVGAGMLGLPGAFGGTGYVGGPLLIFAGAAFSAHGLMLLARAATMVGEYPSSFYTVARAAVPRYTVLIDLAVALKCFGVATGYLITVADCMIDALDHILLPEGGVPQSHAVALLLSRRFWVAAAAFGVLPVSFYRTFDKLKTSSAAALAFVFLLAGGIVAYANGWAGDPCEGYDEDENGGEPCIGEVVPFTDGPTTLSKLPIFIFAFTCQQNIFPIVNEIQRRSIRRVGTVVVGSIGFAMGIFLVVAVEGYLTYGDRVKGDILLNYPEDGKVTFMRVCIAFMLMLHYPLQLDPSRRCVMSLLKVVGGWIQEQRRRRDFLSLGSALAPAPTMGGHVDSQIELGADRQSPPHGEDQQQQHDAYTEISSIKMSSPRRRDYSGVEDQWTDDDPSSAEAKKNAGVDEGESELLFLAVTITFLLCSFGIALTVDDLGVILALVGATGSTLVSYVLPGLIFVKVQSTLCAAKVMAYVQLVVGCLIMPTALYFVVHGERGE